MNRPSLYPHEQAAHAALGTAVNIRNTQSLFGEMIITVLYGQIYVLPAGIQLADRRSKGQRELRTAAVILHDANEAAVSRHHLSRER